MVGDEMEDRIDGDGDGSGEPAADPAGDDDRADHAPSGGDDQERTNRRRQVTADSHASASHRNAWVCRISRACRMGRGCLPGRQPPLARFEPCYFVKVVGERG